MTSPLLDSLKQDAVFESLGIVPTPTALRRALQQVPEIGRVSWAIRRGQITERMVREFTSSLVAGYERGKPLPGDLALAGLAVALESCRYSFAEEYLRDLARLNLAELPLSIQVARECLKARAALPKTEIRRFVYPLCFRGPVGRQFAAESWPAHPRRRFRLEGQCYSAVAGGK